MNKSSINSVRRTNLKINTQCERKMTLLLVCDYHLHQILENIRFSDVVGEEGLEMQLSERACPACAVL